MSKGFLEFWKALTSFFYYKHMSNGLNLWFNQVRNPKSIFFPHIHIFKSKSFSIPYTLAILLLLKMIFKRLLSVKPSKFLNKNEQLKDYYKCFGTTFYTHPNNNSQNKNLQNDSRPASNTSTFMQNQYTGSTINYAQSIMSSKSSVRSYSSNSRLSSAKSTANNSFVDKQSHSSSKPAWENRW